MGTMSFSDMYLCCLLVGVGLSVAAFVSGSIDLRVLHWGHGALHAGELGHPALSHHSGASAACSGGHGGSTLGSVFQFGTVAAFLSWFGATGYILGSVACFEWWLTSLLAACGGVAGAALLLTVVRKILLAHDPTLDPSDFVLVGALGTVSSGIRERGTGEIVVPQPGARYWAAARSADGIALSEGTVVVVLEYREGIASVTPWDDP